MNIVFFDTAWNDYLYWNDYDKKNRKRINDLIKGCQRNPHAGIGKPEPLRHSLSGWWSRRITDEHRMVYKVAGDQLLIAQLRYHYER